MMNTMLLRTLLPAAALTLTAMAADDPWLVFEGKSGPGKGKNVVLIGGDEEYRSEESLPMLGKMLAEKHGFKCTVLFAIDKTTGEINPNEQNNIPNVAAVDSADFVIMALRFRELPDADMKHIVDYVEAGKPLLGMRTSTHAFAYKKKDSPYASWSHDNNGGFGKKVLGETWVNHWGQHGKQSTRGIIEEANKSHPVLTGVEDIWGKTDVYQVGKLPDDAKVLFRGAVLTGMNPKDEVLKSDRNEPQMMPVAWVRERKTDKGETQKVICTTMGAATDFLSPGMGRFVTNCVYWGIGLPIPAKMDTAPVGKYEPSEFGFNGYKKGVKPADLK